MFGLLALSAVLLVSPAEESGDAPCLTRAEFSSWYEAARVGRLAIPSEVGLQASRYRYVFVNGLHIGMTQGCFTQNFKQLQLRGVPRTAIHQIDPSVRKTVAENAATMRAEMLAIASKGPEPLVIIAHSRGACDALAFALMNPEFIETRVRAMFLIQGPLGGSAAADYAAGEGHAIDRKMPPLYRAGARMIGRLESRFLNRDKHEVVASLSRQESDRFWEQLIEDHVESLPVVSSKVFYVTSHTRPSRHPLLQRVTAWYVESYYGPNDGLVALEDQALPGLGKVLAVLDAGHTDLTHRFPSARPRQWMRRALMDSIIMGVGSPQKQPESEPHVVARPRYVR